MIRDFLNSAVQKKFFLMFFTSVIYIVGICSYFADKSVLVAFLLLVFGGFAILKNYLSPKLVIFWYLVFFFGFFNCVFRIKTSDQLYQIAPKDATIQGQIVSIPDVSDTDKTKFFAEVSKINYDGMTENVKAKTLVTVYSNNSDKEFNIGDTFSLKGKLRAPFEVSNPSQFDYGRYLRNFGVFSVFYADGKDCKLIDKKLSWNWKFLQGLNNLRNEIIQSHAKCLKSPNLEILGGIVFGDDAVSPPEYIKNSFKNSGLLHILAASGMNVALIYGIWFFILRRMRVAYNVTVLSGIFVVIFYAMMTGLGPSVVRAAFMLIFVLIGKLIDRDAHSISLLSFVALLMLIYNPAYINDVGFELSFLVTFGLLVMAPVVFEKVKLKAKFIPSWLLGAVFVPVIAQIWVAPIQMYYFNSFSLYSVLANIASLPFVTVISFGGFISSVLALIKPLASHVCLVFDFFLNPILNILVGISNYFSNLPHSLVQIPQPCLAQIFLYYTIVLLITLLLKIGRNKKVIISIVLLSLMLLLSFFAGQNKNFETIFFDVQNADAFLIKTPQGKYFLIDSGKQGYLKGKTQAKMIILEYLKDKGIKNIEGLIITHFDSDHAGGAVDLIENLNIKNVYVNSLSDKSRLAQKIYKSAGNKIKLVKNNEQIYTETEIYGFIFPNPLSLREAPSKERRSNPKNKFIIKTYSSELKGEDSENENSIITLVSDGDFDELFMGDAGIEAFGKVKKYLPHNIEILKVGHHGAKNTVNKEFLDWINPQVGVISTGVNNYGHPNGVTLDILQSDKVRVLRTDRQNAIKIGEKSGQYKTFSYDKNKGFGNE